MRWEVVRLDGSPAVGAQHIPEPAGCSGRMDRNGCGVARQDQNWRDWVGGGGAKHAGARGTARPGEHRLALARGEIRAKISAPPRLFFVDTASGTAVDLGCEYTLNTDEDGFGLLRVTRGWVSFQWKGLESLVPAGASCRTRPHVGPGIPYFDDAPESMKQALESFGFEKAGNDASTSFLPNLASAIR